MDIWPTCVFQTAKKIIFSYAKLLLLMFLLLVGRRGSGEFGVR